MAGTEDEGRLDDASSEADEAESHAAHRADRGPNAEEEQAAERSAKAQSPADRRRVAAAFDEMAERGVEEKGEGRIS